MDTTEHTKAGTVTGSRALVDALLREGIEAVHFKSQVREVRLHLHRARVGEVAQFDEFLALGRLEENQLRTARRLVAAHFHQAEDFPVKLHGRFKVIHPVAGMVEFANNVHGRNHTSPRLRGKRSAAVDFFD